MFFIKFSFIFLEKNRVGDRGKVWGELYLLYSDKKQKEK